MERYVEAGMASELLVKSVREPSDLICVKSEPRLPAGVCVAWLPDPTAAVQRATASHQALQALLVSSVGRFATCIELQEPWSHIPLTPAASHATQFCHDGIVYRFTRGAPGNPASADAAERTVQSIARQLREQGVDAHAFLNSSVVVVAQDFEACMHATAAVHKCLKSAGLSIDGSRSEFTPRRVVSTTGRACSVEFETLHDETVAGAVRCAWEQLLVDAHLSGGFAFGTASLPRDEFVRAAASQLGARADDLDASLATEERTTCCYSLLELRCLAFFCGAWGAAR